MSRALTAVYMVAIVAFGTACAIGGATWNQTNRQRIVCPTLDEINAVKLCRQDLNVCRGDVASSNALALELVVRACPCTWPDHPVAEWPFPKTDAGFTCRCEQPGRPMFVGVDGGWFFLDAGVAP